jgi:hypothetical protein
LTDDKISQSAQEQEQFDQQFLARVHKSLRRSKPPLLTFHTQREMLISSMKLAAKMLIEKSVIMAFEQPAP